MPVSSDILRAVSNSPSELRQRLLELRRRYEALLQKILKQRGPLIRGTFGKRRRVCGVAGCRCARGGLHESKYLSATIAGKTRQVHVPVADEDEVAAGVTRYRRFRKDRTQLAKVIQKQLRSIDELCELLLKPYPPKRPLPPAGRRGPARPKEG